MALSAIDILIELIDTIADARDNDKTEHNDARLLVFGYIRLTTKKNHDNVASDIKGVCCDFYGCYFNGSSILKTMQQRFNLFKLLIENSDNNNYDKMFNFKSTKLLYNLSKDGEDGNVFINKLKNNAPYLFLIKTEYDNICGGYSQVECTSIVNGHYGQVDESAFLFVLESDDKENQLNSEKFPAIKYNRNDCDYYHISYFDAQCRYFGLVSFGTPLAIRFDKYKWENAKNGVHGQSYSTNMYDMRQYPPGILCGDDDDCDHCLFGLKQFEVYHIPNPL